MTDQPLRRYRIDDDVRVTSPVGNPTPAHEVTGRVTGSEDLMCTVVGTTSDRDDRAAEVRAAGGRGPLYVVNGGNVYHAAYELVVAESQMGPWIDGAA